ncbi:baseplate protein [Xanthomonas phage SB4]|uniref:Baseplate protein n=1 Tax=Xanthomonas phage SB4 TaxID=3117473 RepID=A0ABZ2GZM7_9CAUD
MSSTKIGLSGMFQVEVVRSCGKREVVLPWQKNLITDWGMDHMAGKHYQTNSSEFTNYVHVGTGSAVPAFADVKLQSWLGSASLINAVTVPPIPTDPEPFVGYRKVGTFARGAVVGNITELGVSTGQGKDSTLATRALFRDAEGQPVTIVVSSDEQLIITYEMRIYISKTPVVTTVTDPTTGVEYTIKALASNVAGAVYPGYLFSGTMGSSQNGINDVTSYAYHGPNAALGPINNQPLGTMVYGGCDYKTVVSSDGSWSTTTTITVRLGSFNDLDIKCFKVTESSPLYWAPIPWQFEFTPTWRKTADQTVQFDVRMEIARK